MSTSTFPQLLFTIRTPRRPQLVGGLPQLEVDHVVVLVELQGIGRERGLMGDAMHPGVVLARGNDPGNVRAVPTKIRIGIQRIDPLEAVDDHVLPGQLRVIGRRPGVEQADRDPGTGPRLSRTSRKP